MKIGLLQFAPVLNNVDQNISRVDKLLSKAKSADLWVLPELASSGYNFESREDAFTCSEEVDGSKFLNFLAIKAATLGSWIVTGMNEREGDKLYNSAVLVNPGGVAGVYRKLHLFSKEKHIFEPGNRGLPVFESPWGKIGMLVCYDWMFPEAWRILALQGAQLVCHPSNLILPWCQLATPGHALTNRIFIATANRVGTERDLEFTGRSQLVTPGGELILKGTKENEESLVASIEISEANNKTITNNNHAFNDRRADSYKLEW